VQNRRATWGFRIYRPILRTECGLVPISRLVGSDFCAFTNFGQFTGVSEVTHFKDGVFARMQSLCAGRKSASGMFSETPLDVLSGSRAAHRESSASRGLSFRRRKGARPEPRSTWNGLDPQRAWPLQAFPTFPTLSGANRRLSTGFCCTGTKLHRLVGDGINSALSRHGLHSVLR
jgi:hypothetical protein